MAVSARSRRHASLDRLHEGNQLMNETNGNKSAWYHHPVPWFMLAVILATITSGIMMIVLSTSDPDDIVVDDYYKQGLGINRNKARNNRAKSLGISPSFTTDKGVLNVQVQGIRNIKPGTLRLHLQHPTRKRLDKVVLLSCKAQVCRGSLPLPETSRYYFSIEPADREWRSSGRIHIKKGRVSVEYD